MTTSRGITGAPPDSDKLQDRQLQDDRIYTAREVGVLLNRSYQTIHNWVKNEGLPMRSLTGRKNGIKLIMGEDLRRWIKGYRD